MIIVDCTLVIIMNYNTGTEGYYRKMLELQEKLRRSEEERMKLEEKFNETMRYTRDAEHERLRVLRHKYHRFLEEDRVRQDRNENILRALERIESRAKTFAAKTDRFKALRKQYDAYIRRIYTTKHQQPEVYTRAQQSSDTHPYQSYPNARKQLFADLPATQRSDTKIAMLEQYLQDNFNSCPNQKTRESVLNENEMFSRQNGFSAAYVLPEEPSENRNHVRQNYRQSETVDDSDSKDSQEFNIENGFPSRRSDSRLAQNELEFVPNFPAKDCLQLKKTEKNELLGNTIELELNRFRDKECAKQKTDIEVAKAPTPDPYVENYKDLVSKSAKKFGLHNGSLVKRTSDQNIDVEDENVLATSVLKCNVPVSNKIVPDTSSEQREENTINFAKHQDNENESPIIKKILKAEDVERNKEELLHEQQLVSEEQRTDDGEVKPSMEKLEALEQDDNVDMRSKTPEVSSARTEPPDDITLTTPSPIHLPLSAESIVTQKQESLVSDDKKSPVHLDEKFVESAVVQPSGISKDLQNDNAQDNLIPQVTDTEQTKSLVTENQNYPIQHESKDSENYVEPNQELDQNYPVEASIVEKQPRDEELQQHEIADQPVYDNQDYQNVDGQQVYQEEYQPQDGYDPQSYPIQERGEAQPEVYDAEQYHMDQQQYPVDQQQYSADQEHYGVDQQQYPIDQEQYLVSQEEYPTDQQPYHVDQQQYPAEQYPVDEQKYPGTDAEQHYPVTQQEYPVDKEQYLQDQQYPTDQQEYPTEQEQYPVHQQQYITDVPQEYTADQQQYQGDYPPEQYSEEPQQYIEGQPTDYDPTQYPQNYVADEPYTGGEYEVQQYPEGYNQDVYRSEQEYLQGEQNVDLQYQAEVTGEEYQGEFSNQENQPQLQQDGGSTIEQDHQPHESITPQQSSSEPVQRQVKQETSLPAKQNISESTEKSATQNVVQPEDKPLVEKKLPNLADMLDTDTESTKQETKVSNDSDFDFSNT